MNPPDLLFGKFRTLNCLKKDENGSVWLAHHIYLDQPVILKILQPGAGADAAAVERFQREARLLARLHHPHIIRVLDFSVVDTAFYISFEYFAAQSLRQRLNAGDLSLGQKGAILAQVTAALEAAHTQQIIHRDVKPENILINAGGEVKLADFGLALPAEGAMVTLKSAIVGTPAYMSPEQVRGEALSPASDLFSLGIVAHELFYGRHPFLDRDVTRTLNNILAGEEVVLPPEPALPEGLARLIAALLRKRREERPGSAAGVRRLLEQIFPDLRLSRSEEGGTLVSMGEESGAVPPRTKVKGPRPLQGTADGAVPRQGEQSGAVPPVHPARERRSRPKRGWAWAGLLALAMAAVLLFLGRPFSLDGLEFGRSLEPVVRESRDDQAGHSLRPEGSENGDAGEMAVAGLRPSGDHGDRGGPAAAPGPQAALIPGGLDSSAGLNQSSRASGASLVPEENDAASATSPDSGALRQQEAAGDDDAADGLDKTPGLLYITCEPWAEIFIDSVRIDVTPLQEPLRLFPGRHELWLRHPEYPDYRQILPIEPRQPLRVAVDLNALFGWLELRIHPWAEVWLDSVGRGQTPLGRPLALEPGGHRLRLRHPDFGEVEDYVAIVRGETTRFELNMTRLAGRKE